MLSLVAAKQIRPESDALDRDPGILTLIVAFSRFTARHTGALVRSVSGQAGKTDVFSSSTAWPHNPGAR